MVPIAAVFYVAFRIDWKLPGKDLWDVLKLGFVGPA